MRVLSGGGESRSACDQDACAGLSGRESLEIPRGTSECSGTCLVVCGTELYSRISFFRACSAQLNRGSVALTDTVAKLTFLDMRSVAMRNAKRCLK